MASVGAAAVHTATASAAGCTKYASRAGSDTNSGTEASPFKTAQKLLDSLSAGQTGCLRGGVYDETSTGYVLRFPRAGTATAPITVRSYPGERARLVGIVTVPSGADHVALTDVDVEGTGSANTIKIYASDVVIARNDITNVHRGLSCMMLGSNTGGGQAVRPLIQRNVFHECGSPLNDNKDHGIYASNVTDGQVVDNVIRAPSGYAMQLYPNAQRTRVAHNVIDGTGSIRGGIVFAGDSTYASSGNVVEQNVIAYPATHAITSNWGTKVGTGNVARNNCVWGASTLITSPHGFSSTGNLTTDPRFLDRPRDYRLGALSCLSVVGYDTAALLLGTSSPEPQPTPTPNAAPSVSWTAPGNGGTVSGTLTSIDGKCAVSAADDVAVDRVEFFLDGAPLGVDRAAPYACDWDTTTVADGPHALKAVAYDAAGQSTSAVVQVTVANAPAGRAPVVTLNTPLDGATFKKYLRFDATATDDERVTKVEFYVDGRLAATETSAPYSQFWSGAGLTYGTHTVTARAYDNDGLTSTSAPAVVTRAR